MHLKVRVLDLDHDRGEAAFVAANIDAVIVVGEISAARPESAGKRVVVVLPDGGGRYAGSPVLAAALGT